ncbi:uncharacterized protein LOC143564118 [Bidens hawaiensis]|uniref:uncharacterized protein LOC143564118 n=1 Tax=Bidens hawaiensis TaxID=980011 RepID=UPI00404B2CE5
MLNCGRRHFGICALGNVRYRCCKPGHVISECPEPSRACYECRSTDYLRNACPKLKNKLAKNKPNGRAFHMTAEEAWQADNVITGTFLLIKLPTTVLFDSGANKSFISYKFCHALSNPLKKLEQSFTLEIANGKQIKISEAIDDCFLNLEGKLFPIRMMATMLGEFDLVIGMDWLALYKAQINCDTKSIKLQAPDESIVTIYGDREKRIIKIISVMKATKMIHHGCFAYLAYAINTQKETKKVEEVSVVCEFPDVFPKELPGIPPDREVEFKIDLVPRAKLVAKAPYCFG